MIDAASVAVKGYIKQMRTNTAFSALLPRQKPPRLGRDAQCLRL